MRNMLLLKWHWMAAYEGTLNARGSIWSDVIGACCQKTLEIFISIKFCLEGHVMMLLSQYIVLLSRC